MRFEDAIARYISTYPGFGANQILPSPVEQQAQITHALECAQAAEFSDRFRQGRGHIHTILRGVKAFSPEAAAQFEQKVLADPSSQNLVKSIEFMCGVLAERSPETLSHIQRHAALTMLMHAHESQAQQNTENEQVKTLLTAILHDAGKLAIDPGLLHKHARIDASRFKEAVEEFAQKVPDYPEKRHDLTFLVEAQTGQILFANPNQPLPEATGHETINWDQKQLRGEESFTSDGDKMLHSTVMLRIHHKALESGLTHWLNDKELFDLASDLRGTLTPSERAILSTHDPMSALYAACQPLPSGLQDLPAMLDLHQCHGANASAASQTTRLVQLTDVFDALTSKRAYKQPYTVSEALHTMQHLSERGELDKKLFHDFVESGAWYDAAREFNLEVGDLGTIAIIKAGIKASIPGSSQQQPSWMAIAQQQKSPDMQSTARA